jgi:hypothetical protein
MLYTYRQKPISTSVLKTKKSQKGSFCSSSVCPTEQRLVNTTPQKFSLGCPGTEESLPLWQDSGIHNENLASAVMSFFWLSK